MEGLILLASLIVLLCLGVPVAYALGLSALAYFLAVDPYLIQASPQRLFAGMDSYVLISLPFFILMGQVMNVSGITRRLIEFSLIFVGRLPGGLGLVNVLASMSVMIVTVSDSLTSRSLASLKLF